MKALCIDAAHRPGDIKTGWQVKKGKPYTVNGSFNLYRLGLFYTLVEDPDRDECGKQYGFAADRFRLLSSNDGGKKKFNNY